MRNPYPEKEWQVKVSFKIPRKAIWNISRVSLNDGTPHFTPQVLIIFSIKKPHGCWGIPTILGPLSPFSLWPSPQLKALRQYSRGISDATQAKKNWGGCLGAVEGF